MWNVKRAAASAVAIYVFAAGMGKADPAAAQQTSQITVVPKAALPDVVIHPGEMEYRYYTPDVPGHGPKPGGGVGNIPARHFKVPAGYDDATWLHPYTSGLGPCTEGAAPAQGCRHPTGTPIAPSHYQRPPFNQ